MVGISICIILLNAIDNTSGVDHTYIKIDEQCVDRIHSPHCYYDSDGIHSLSNITRSTTLGMRNL